MVTWRKLTVPNGVWIGCIWGSSVSNMCWIRDSLLSRGLCHETWSPLQNVFSIGTTEFSLLIFLNTRYHTCRFQTFPWGFYLHCAFEGVPSSTNGKRSYFPTSCFSTVQGLLKKGCNNRKRDDRYGEWVTKTKKRSSLHKGKHRTALWSQPSWGVMCRQRAFAAGGKKMADDGQESSFI